MYKAQMSYYLVEFWPVLIIIALDTVFSGSSDRENSVTSLKTGRGVISIEISLLNLAVLTKQN